MEINTVTIKEFRKDFSDAVKSLESEYGVSISMGRVTYSTGDFRCKMTVENRGTQPAVDGVTENKNVQDKDEFEYLAGIKDVPTEWYKKIFTYKKKTYQITSLSLSRPKYAVGVIDVRTGATLKTSIESIRSMTA